MWRAIAKRELIEKRAADQAGACDGHIFIGGDSGPECEVVGSSLLNFVRGGRGAMSVSKGVLRHFAIFGAVAIASAMVAFAQTEGRLLRFPDIHGNQVAFSYAGDLWLT